MAICWSDYTIQMISILLLWISVHSQLYLIYLTLGINAFFQPRIMFDARKSGMLPMEKMKEVYTAWENGQKPILLFKTCSTILQLHYGFIAPENLTGEEYPADILQI